MTCCLGDEEQIDVTDDVIDVIDDVINDEMDEGSGGPTPTKHPKEGVRLNVFSVSLLKYYLRAQVLRDSFSCSFSNLIN